MLNKETLRALAESERLMDEGKIPFVWMMSNSGKYERMAVAPTIMEELGLENGQSINTIIQDAIADMSLKILAEKLDSITQEIQDGLLTTDFDFRKEMKDDNDPTNS
jgi:hypothetical protein